MGQYESFEMPGKIVYGQGSFAKLGEESASLGKKALIISDAMMEKFGYIKQLSEILDESDVAHAEYLGANTEPTDVYVKEALKIFHEEGCDLVIALGGGSCIDTAKAVSVVATNGGYIGDYMGNKKIANKISAPLVILPTTAGTGSEVTNVTVITNTSEDVKMMIKQSAFLARVSIVDPVFTMTAPPKITASTGIDALCHAVESYYSRRAQPLTRIFSRSAISLITGNLLNAYRDKDDVGAHVQMSLAATEAGIAFSNASVTLVHGMSRPIGALFHVPHGVSNAMLLPGVLEFTKEAALQQLSEIGQLISPDAGLSTDEAWADEAIKRIKELCHNLDIPSMREWGIKREELENVVEKMAIDAIDSGSPANNPRMPTKEEIVALYRRCYDYDFKS